nr:unnamed protein product [Callosobruchus chinensis]
MRPWTI